MTLQKASDILKAVEIITNPTSKVGYSSRPFVITAFPSQRVKGKSWVRKNGNATLTIAATEDSEVPYGSDRLIPIFLASRAVKTRSRRITFETASEILDFFGLDKKAGINYRRLIASLERVFKASVFFKIESDTYTQQARFHFINGMELWKKEAPTDQPRLEGLSKNVITLSQEFFEEILRHPIPLDLEIIKLLRNNPLVLDVYMFLAYKAATVKKPTSIPLSELEAAFGSNLAVTNPRVFKARLKKAVGSVCNLASIQVSVVNDQLVIGPSRKAIRVKNYE